MLTTSEDLADLVRCNDDGVYRLNRRIYSDPNLFELELEHIFGKVWNFVAHESQLRKKNDFVTTHVGRQHVIVMRNRVGAVGAFLNACSHRGAQLCRTNKGNSGVLSCPYHGWTYNSNGDLLSPKDEASGAYPETFDKTELGLRRLRTETYRGFVFACLDDAVEPLDEYLGEAKLFIDLVADQGGERGMELLKGVSRYTYDGNWKLQVENGNDGYHVTSVHWNYMSTQKHRLTAPEGAERLKTMNVIAGPDKVEGGYFDLGRGHTMIWGDWSNPQDRFNVSQRDELVAEIGELHTRWALGRLRNVLFYPNFFVMDQQSSQLRVIRPLAVDKTEVTVYCIAPIGEPPENRRNRIRQYEDFFNASGMATPDDLSEFEASQRGFAGTAAAWSDFSRGAGHQLPGANRHAVDIGLQPKSSGAWIDDEGVFHGQYRRWVELMAAALGAAR